MSETDVEVLRQAYEAFNRGDVVDAFDSFAPEFECDMSRAVGINVSRDTYNLAQFRRLVDEYAKSWESFQLGADEFIDAADHVVVPFTNRARSHTLGVDMQGRGTSVWTFRDGAIIRACLYQELDEAFEAAGMSE
jgi:ketosteroid isomerase-like protein